MPKNPLKSPDLYINRELSWLEFNHRVLQEGLAEELPLLERLKFLAIVASNLDEFFLVRVAGLMRRRAAKVRRRDASGMTAAEQLAAISRRTHRMVDEQAAGVREVFARLAEHGLFVWERQQWTEEQRQFLQTYFAREIQPILTPLAIEELTPGPLLPNLQLHVAALLVSLWERGRGAGHRPESAPVNQPALTLTLSQRERGRTDGDLCRTRRGGARAQPVAAVGVAAGGEGRASGAGGRRDRGQPFGRVPRLRGGGRGRLPHYPRRRRRAARRRGNRRSVARDGRGGAVAPSPRRRAADDFRPCRAASAEMAGRLAQAQRRRRVRGRRSARGRGVDGDREPARVRRPEDRRLAAASAARPDRGRRPLGRRCRTTTCCCFIPTRVSTRW